MTAPALTPALAQSPAAGPAHVSVVNPSPIPEVQGAMAGRNFQLHVLLRNGV